MLTVPFVSSLNHQQISGFLFLGRLMPSVDCCDVRALDIVPDYQSPDETFGTWYSVAELKQGSVFVARTARLAIYSARTRILHVQR